MKALILVDLQNDFCPGGALAVNEGDKIIPLINGLQDKFLAYWEVIAATFADNPYVIGFDPLNEPLPSMNGVMDLITNIAPSGGVDANLLEPLYADIYEILQKPDKNATLWFEPA